MRGLKKRLTSLVLVIAMLVSMFPMNVMATGTEINHVPSLKDGVNAEQTVTIQTGLSYQLDDLMNGKIFEDVDGDKLTYQNYFYQKSSDNGLTWGEITGFTAMEHGGVNSSLSNSVEGTYIYRFFAYDGKGYSEDTWTLTLKVMDVVTENITFYVGQDQNYSSHKTYPVMELYKTAGIDDELYDYVGWFINGEDKIEYVYNPADYEIEDGDTTDYVLIGEAKFELHDYEKIDFTNSTFDDSDESAVASGTLVNKYNMFYASIESGRYSTRFYGYNSNTSSYDIYLGGQSMALPMEKDIYGGGGNDLYFRLVSCHTTSKKTDGTYFGKDDYHVEMIMPVTGSMIHSGDAYVDGNYVKYPFMSYAAGNASLYNIYAYPTDTENYIFSQTINNTTAAGDTVVNKTVSIATAYTLDITVPENGDFGLYLQYNNFNTKEVEPLGEAVSNGDGTKTLSYKVSKGNGNYTWRLEDLSGTYVTKAGWLKNITANSEETITFSNYTDQKSHSFDNLGTQVDTRDEADIQVFLDHDGFKGVNGTYRVRAYRMWELINSDTANIIIEPNFNVQVLDGNPNDISLVDGGNASNNWLDVTPTTTDIIAVNYNAIDVYSTSNDYGSHGGFFPATNPERTGVFVITNEEEGKADASVMFNGSVETDRGGEWDYNYDTWYYMDTDKNPTLDFTVKSTGDVSVSYAVVTTDKNLKSTLSDWTTVASDEEGNYSADLLKIRNADTHGGTVIIKMTDSTGTSYRLVRVAEMSVTAENASNPGEAFMPGDEVTLSFSGLYRAVNKVAGIFNPTTYYLKYNSGETEVNGVLPQYQQMDNATITLSIPEDLEIGEEGSTEYTFTNGHIFGSMYSASSPFSTLYEMTDTGVGTNFSAVGVSFVLSKLADVTITVEKKVLYDVHFNIMDGDSEVEDAVLEIKDSEGNVQVPNENGNYSLGYGKYDYSIKCPGYVCYYGSFSLDSNDVNNLENGLINKTVTLTKASPNAWDGVTTSEPKADENGVYKISTGAELAWLAATVNGGTTNISAVLTADIDLAGYDWAPIGNNSKKFAGSFDGQGHKVYNLAIDYSETSTAAPYAGLFGCVAGKSSNYAEIKNFTVQGLIKLTSTKSVSNAYSGGAVGHGSYVNITNVHSNVDITVKRVLGNWNYVGGIAGYLSNKSNVKDCSNEGTVNAYKYGAGIVGGSYATTITGCVNMGTITSATTHAAGIASLSSGKTEGCYNLGTISATTTNAGGIVGAASKGATVKNSFNAGNVSCTDSTHGAAIGNISDANVVVADVYYLEGTGANGIGTAKDENTQKAISVSEEALASEEFVEKINNGLEEAIFKDGGAYPLLIWQPNAKEYAVDIPESDLFNVLGNAFVAEGKYYRFTVDVEVGYKEGDNFAVKVNGETVEPDDNGIYVVKKVTSDLIITVEGIEKIEWSPVSVYFSVSHDDNFVSGKEDDTIMALHKIDVPYFDLALYGMEDFYFSSESYGDDGDGEPGSALDAGTAAGAYGKITMLHLYIYATEIYYCGLEPEDAGKGYLYKENLIGTDTFTYTGSVGSIYFNKLWGMDENLNYYLNYEYPLASEGWGSTADQILLEDGDVVTVGHFTDWNFYTDPNSVFNYIKAGDDVVETTVEQGKSVEMTVYLAGASETEAYKTAHTVVTSNPYVYYIAKEDLDDGDVANWELLGQADNQGNITVNTRDMDAGEYVIAVSGQYGTSKGLEDSICSAPGAIILTVDKPMLGDVNIDGVVDTSDASVIISYYYEKIELTSDQLAVADVNNDGVVDTTDASMIISYYYGKINDFTAS